MFVVYELCVVSQIKHREENSALFQAFVIKTINNLCMYPKNKVKGIDEHIITCMTNKMPLICLKMDNAIDKN